MSYTYNYRIADMTFQVTSIYPYVHCYCKSYMIREPGEHSILLTQADIDNERVIAQNLSDDDGVNAKDAPDYYLESVALLRKLAEYICGYDRLLMHGSAIAINGNGYIFTAVSGTGKSTHTKLLRQLHGDNAVMINDDKPFLRYCDGQVYISGTPWMGKHSLGNKITVPLKGIFFLYRSENNTIDTLSPSDALVKMIAQCHRPSDPMQMIKTLDLVDNILAAVPLYNLGCNMDISAAELSSSVMQ